MMRTDSPSTEPICDTSLNLELDDAFQKFASHASQGTFHMPLLAGDEAVYKQSLCTMTEQPSAALMRNDAEDNAAAAIIKCVHDSTAKGGIWLHVTHLQPHATSQSLLQQFFPYGADEAFVVSTSTPTGLVLFRSVQLALLAQEKLAPPASTMCFAMMQPEDVLQCLNTLRSPVTIGGALPKLAPPTRTTRSPLLETSLSNLVQSHVTTPQNVAHYIQQLNDPRQVADEVCREVTASAATLRKYALSLAAILESWPCRRELQRSVVRGLLSILFSPDVTDAQREGAGALLGELFASQFVAGDPFDLASKLARAELERPSSILAIGNLVQRCAPLQFPSSAASFWALMTDLSSSHPVDAVRAACKEQLQMQFPHKREGLSPHAAPFVSAVGAVGGSLPPALGNSPPSFDFTTPKKSTSPPMSPFGPPQLSFGTPPRPINEESRMRTVYASRVSPQAPLGKFMMMLHGCGEVNKVRLCSEDGYSTLYGFIEMATLQGTRALLSLDKSDFYGSIVRFQLARSPIQDLDTHDAIVGGDGTRVRHCLFGTFVDATTPLGACTTRNQPKVTEQPSAFSTRSSASSNTSFGNVSRADSTPSQSERLLQSLMSQVAAGHTWVASLNP